jgi:hypothetical protein
MIDTTEIADWIFRISMWDEKDLVEAGIFWPGVSYNLFLVRDRKPALIQTMYRKTFASRASSILRSSATSSCLTMKGTLRVRSTNGPRPRAMPSSFARSCALG